MATLEATLTMRDNFSNTLDKFNNAINTSIYSLERLQNIASNAWAAATNIGGSLSGFDFDAATNKAAQAIQTNTAALGKMQSTALEAQRTASNIGSNFNLDANIEAAANKLNLLESEFDALWKKYNYQEKLANEISRQYDSAIASRGAGSENIGILEKKLADVRLAQAGITENLEKTNATMLKQYDIVERMKTPIAAPRAAQLAQPVNTQTEMFKNIGAERFAQGINSAQQMTQQLASAQQSIQSGTTALEKMQSTAIETNAVVSGVGNSFNLDANIEAATIKLLNMEAILNGVSDKYRHQEKVISELSQTYDKVAARWGKESEKAITIKEKLINAKLAQARLNETVDKTNTAYLKQYDLVEHMKSPIAAAAQQQAAFNEQLQKGGSTADRLLGSIKKIVGAYLGFAAVKNAIGTVGEWLGLTDKRISAETQLATVMSNMGASRADYDAVLQKAVSLQGSSPYLADSFIASAGELATYLKSGTAVEKMMDTLSNYAAGMGGINVDKTAMVNYATQLGKALEGRFDGLSEKGFIPTEAEKNILKYGNELERVNVLTGIISRNWDGLSAVLANTPLGRLAQMKNEWSDIKQSLGTYLYPYVLKFLNVLHTNMPVIRTIMFGFAGAIATVVYWLSIAADIGGKATSLIIDGWSFIGPVIWGVVGAIVAYNIQTLIAIGRTGIAVATKFAHAAAIAAQTLATIILTAATGGLTAAQGVLNATLYACPISWILMGIIAIIAIFYLAVAAVNYFAETSYSATGIIAGAFMALAAHIHNAFIMPMWNIFAAFVNFIGNAFNSPVAAIKVLFYDLAVTVIDYISEMARAIETIINRIPGVKVSITAGLDNFKGSLESKAAKIKDEAGFTDIVKRIDERLDIGRAYDKGYDFGSNLFKPKLELPGLDFDFNGTGHDPSNAETAKNTKGIKDAMGILDEDLKYLRDIADREYINNTNYSNVKIDMSNMTTTVNNKGDLDGYVDGLATYIQERISIAAEGVHN